MSSSKKGKADPTDVLSTFTIDLTPSAAGYRGIALMFIQDVVGRIQGNQAKKDTEELLGTVVKIAMYLAVNEPVEAHKLLGEVYHDPDEGGTG